MIILFLGLFSCTDEIEDVPEEPTITTEPVGSLAVPEAPVREEYEPETVEYEYEEEPETENDLMYFVRNGHIGGLITGISIREISIRLMNNTEVRLAINLPIGLYFVANSGNVQNMVLTESRSVSVGVGDSISLMAAVACMNIYKDIPGEADIFSPAMLEDSDPLVQLLNLLAYYNSEFEVIQAAVWYLRENPGRQAIIAALEHEDGERAITDEQLDEAVRFVEMVRR